MIWNIVFLFIIKWLERSEEEFVCYEVIIVWNNKVIDVVSLRIVFNILCFLKIVLKLFCNFFFKFFKKVLEGWNIMILCCSVDYLLIFYFKICFWNEGD